MAAKKRKAKKTAAKARPAPSRKTKATRKAKKTAKAPARKATKKSAKRPAQKATGKTRAVRKAPARKTAKRAARKKQTVGEGDYTASRAFLKDQSNFVEKNKANIPGMGRAAEEALDGREGDDLRNAEAIAAARSRDTF